MALNWSGNQYLLVDDADSLDITGDITALAWVKITDTDAYRTILSKPYAGTYSEYNYQFAIHPDEKIFFFHRNSSNQYNTFTSTGIITTGIWQLIGYSISANVLTFYIGGQSTGGGGTLTYARSANTNPLCVGVHYLNGNNPNTPSYTQVFVGEMGDVRLYNRALSADEWKIIYEARGSDNIVNGLVMRLLMNEKVEGSTPSGNYSVIDISNEGNHATPKVAPTYRAELMKLVKPKIVL